MKPKDKAIEHLNKWKVRSNAFIYFEPFIDDVEKAIDIALKAQAEEIFADIEEELYPEDMGKYYVIDPKVKKVLENQKIIFLKLKAKIQKFIKEN